MEPWVGVLLLLLALACLGVAIFLAVRYVARLRASRPAPTSPEDPNDLTLKEGIGLDDGTLTSGAFDTATPRSTARLRYVTRGVANDVLLDQPVTNVGRGSANQVDVGDLLVSRRHARILLEEDGEYWIEDLQSHNHTFVNGVLVTRQKLTRDDRIKVGETLLTFVRDSGRGDNGQGDRDEATGMRR